MDKENKIESKVEVKEVIIAQAAEFKVKDFNSIKAEILNSIKADVDPDGDNDSEPDDDDLYTKSEVNQMMMSLYSTMVGYMNELYSSVTQGDRGLAKQVNSYIESHVGTHLPPLHPGQIKAMLEKCGIADDFAEAKPPMIDNNTPHIYASAELKSKMKDIKFDVK